jgi:glycosyltransferase involved in cell wall biosynthesis
MIFSRSYGVKILKNASKIILLSPSFKKTIFTKYVPKKYWKEILSKIEIVPNGVDEFWFVNKDTKISKINDGAIKLLYVGRFYFNKNIFRILLIQYKLLMMGFTSTLTLIGNTNQSLFEKIIYKFAAKIKNTIVLPKLPKEALLRHYKESSIYVMPSHYESFGLTYVEALTQGKPIIYTKNQGIDGFFKNGSIGYAVNSKNTGEIICAIHKIVRNYCATSANCLIACERFEWENIEKKYLQMLSLFDDC